MKMPKEWSLSMSLNEKIVNIVKMFEIIKMSIWPKKYKDLTQLFSKDPVLNN